jgi:transposase InsO family protein
VEAFVASRQAADPERRRANERAVRRRAVAFARTLREQAPEERATRLGLSVRTLRAWHGEWATRRLPPRRRGAPCCHASDEEKLVILALVALLGTRLSYERIRFFLPGLGRREARAWLRRCWRDWARARERGQALLRWLAPGTVWAMDFSEAPTPIEGRYRYLLSVRDLASGMQLVALPCHDTTEATAAAALEAAFRAHGAPLVLKTDNGSAFTAGAFRALLEAYGVTALYSPPRWPRYNGACEAGIGGLKTRAHHLSAWAGRPGEWTCEDVERARCYGNEFGRPFGRSRPVPAASWSGRVAPTPEACDAFREALARHREALAATRHPESGRSRLALDERTAITRALTELGYLEFKTRRVSLPISRPLAAGIL